MSVVNQFDRVVWAEGVVLGQQHFQCWDNYYHDLLNLQRKIIAPYSWGIIDLEIDEYALFNQQFKLQRCLALFKSGVVANYYASNELVLQCDLRNLGVGEKSELFLEVANGDQVMGIAGYPTVNQVATRQVCYHNVTDLYDNKREREVMFGKLCLKLKQHAGNRDSFQMLKIAEVENVGGQIKLATGFVPAVTNIAVSRFLADLTNQLRELLVGKITILQANNSPKNMRQLLLLNILSEALVKLNHLAAHLELHPRELFLVLTSLVSKLCALSTNLTLSHLPEYEHEQLSSVFSTLRQLLLRVIDEVMPNRAREVELLRETRSLYLARNLDDALLLNDIWLLAIKLTDRVQLDSLLKQIKIAAPTVIEPLTIAASSGVEAILLKHLPDGLSPKVDYSYFHLQKTGSYWQQIRREKSLAIFVPESVAEVELELISLAEECHG